MAGRLMHMSFMEEAWGRKKKVDSESEDLHVATQGIKQLLMS